MTPISPKLIPLALIAAFAQPALAQKTTPAATQNTYVTGSLKNGLQYLILTVPSEKGRIDVRVQVGTGASDENGSSEIGTAHMVEHMVFRSNPQYPNGVGDTLIANGWRRGVNFNAVTNYERTLYMFSPNEGTAQLHETLKALSSMLAPHTFSAADWDKEKQIILAEWRNGLGVNERMNRKRTAVIRSGSRQARYGIIGTPESINNTPVQVLQDFHARWYVPNNMKLIISGDVQPAATRALIEQYFGSLKSQPLPERTGDYYEPKLQNGWNVEQIQDKDSGASQVALIFRLDDSTSRSNTPEGGRERLIDRFADKILAQRLRAQQSNLPKSVTNISLRKADIGRHTVGVGLFASVLPDAHQQGITALLNARAQMLQYPVTQAEVDAYRATLQKVIAQQKTKTALREPFGDVLQTVSDNFFADKPIRTPAENARRAEANLDRITPAQVTVRIQQWLNASDKLVQMQAPSLTPIALPSNDSIAAAQQAERTRQPKLLTAREQQGKGAFTDQPQAHKITGERSQALSGSLKSQITYWTLPNGDNVVLLQSPVAKDKIYWQAIGKAGFMQPEQNPWQTQLASQIIWQSAPQGWTSEQLGAWKNQHKISLNQSTEAQQSKVTGNAPQSEAQNLFHLYHAYYATPQISEDYCDSIANMARQIAMNNQSSRSIKENATVKLRYGKSAYEMPSPVELDETEEPQLFAQWQKLNRAPVTHYILTSQPAAQIKPQVERYLADQPRQANLAPSAPHNPLSGSEVSRQAVNNVERSDVVVYSFSEQAWQPETAAQVSLLRDLAYEQLKAELRDKQLGVYSLKFETSFNPDSNRVESELRFATTPDKAEMLWQLGERVLQNFPNTLTEAQAAALRAKLAEQESKRKESPETWLNRLILSQTHFGDARYLNNMASLPNSITLDNLRQTARLLWNSQNRRALIADPDKGGQ